MGVDYGVIWAAGFNNDIKYEVCRSTRRPRVTRRPPSHKLKRYEKYIDFGVFGLLIKKIILYFTSSDLPAVTQI